MQEELLAKSRAHAAQELALEMKILEARSMATHGFSSASAFVLDETAPPREVTRTSGGVGAHGTRRGTPPSRLDPIDL